MGVRGRVRVGKKLKGCCRNGIPPCDRPQEPDPGKTIANAVRDINSAFAVAAHYADLRLHEAGLDDQIFRINAVERNTEDGKVIGVTTVGLTLGKLLLGASVTAGVVTVGIMTAGGPQDMPAQVGPHLTAEQYRDKLKDSCVAAETKLAKKREGNAEALPLTDLVAVLEDQLAAVGPLGAPDELAPLHARMVGATQDRIALLKLALAEIPDKEEKDPDQPTTDRVSALLEQADVAAEQVTAAYIALEVPECAE